MHKSLLVALAFFLLGNGALQAQDMKTFHLYHPDEDAARGIQQAVNLAKAENKHVLVQIGGNWCVWCARFQQFSTSDPQVDSLIKADYIVYHLNYSAENRNKEILAGMGYPQRFGFPVFIILDGEGARLHTQNSAYLEDGAKGYNKSKVMEFLENWTVGALDPSRYTNY